MTRPAAAPSRAAAVYRAVAIVAAAGLGVLAVALIAGGVVTEKVVPGIGDPGTLTRWGLPVARYAMDIAAALTVGVLLMAAFLLPSDGGRLAPTAERLLRGATWPAAGWAAAAAATLIFTVADLLGEPVARVLTGNELSSYAGQLPQGVALMFVILLAALIALFARTAATPGAAAGLLALALVTLLPPPLTGHSAAAPNHSVAVTGLALHVAAIAPWVGGLVVLGRYALRGGDRLGVAAQRFSRMALWCYVAVGISGAANAVSRLPSPGWLLTDRYGQLILAKAAALALLGWLGWRHRSRTLPGIMAGRPGAFARLATVEAAVMTATVGIAVALSQAAPPAPATSADPVRDLLGYPMPPPITVARLAAMWRLDLFFAVLTVVGAGLYLAGVLRLRRRGDRWPAGRTASWLFGLLTIVIVTMSGVATYAPVLFSVHMAEHMVLSMLSPIFLVLGAPVTLALRALRPAAVRGDRGPREWLTVMLHSRAAGLLTHPVVATAIFIGSTYALYFSPLFESVMRTHTGHIAMTVHFLAAGSLFFWVLIGVDPGARRLPYLVRLLTLFVTMPFHAFFGIALMNLGEPLAAGWYDLLHRPWGASSLSDQHTGGAIAWGFGEIPTFIVLLAIVFQWAVEDQRLARRLERKADRAEAEQETDELSAYNDYLAALEKRSRSGSRDS